MIEVDSTRLEQALDELSLRLEARVRGALETSSVAIADRAKRDRGINGGWVDRSGHLAASIRALPVVGSMAAGFAVDIFAGLDGVFYAPFIHWGTSRGIRPRLFLTLAMRDETSDVIARLTAAVERAIKEAGL